MNTRQRISIASLMATIVLLTGCESVKSISDSSSTAAPATATAVAVKPGAVQQVKGVNGWEGEISGTPAANSKFTQLQIGMGMRQVIDLAGQPTDQGAYMTGKAWIPFYFGSDRHRHEMTYKGQGSLIFAGGSIGNMSSANLISIIHNPLESGYR